MLCQNGTVKYVVKEEITAITDVWLFEHVVPNMCQRFHNDSRLCKVMALSLLYICLSSKAKVYVPGALRNRVKVTYAALGLDEDEPIKKISLLIYRVNGVLMIDEIDGGGTAGGGAVGPNPTELQQTVLVHLNRLENMVTQ